jgi:exodeoxyribonuclease VII small subunit
MDNKSVNDTISGTSGQEVKGIEEAFAMLDRILAKMDEEGVTLEESFKCYEQGMKLIKYCNETIDTVEKKVRVLSAGGEQDEFSV